MRGKRDDTEEKALWWCRQRLERSCLGTQRIASSYQRLEGPRDHSHLEPSQWAQPDHTFLCLVAQSCPAFCDSMVDSFVAHQAPLSMKILQARILEWVDMPSSRGSSQPRELTQVPHIVRQILYSLSHPGSPRILEWVAYSLRQGIFRTQESNQGLLQCRRILLPAELSWKLTAWFQKAFRMRENTFLLL